MTSSRDQDSLSLSLSLSLSSSARDSEKVDTFLEAMRDLPRIPPGFEFKPTDQQLVTHYLKGKVHGQDIEDCIIPEIDIYNYEPWELRGTHPNRDTKLGYWRACTSKDDIKHNGKVVGTKLYLVYLEGQNGSGKKTNWVMKEIYLHEDECKNARLEMDTFLKAMSDLSHIPPGFGFNPTNQQLITHYLKRKVHGEYIEERIIPEIDIYNLKPWELPANCKVPGSKSKCHFFTRWTHPNRVTKSGYWKTTTSTIYHIKHCYKVVGTRQRLVFCEGERGYGKETHWEMDEYCLHKDEYKDAMLKDLFVICRFAKSKESEQLSADTSPPENLSSQTNLMNLSSQMNFELEQSNVMAKPVLYHFL